MAQYDICFTVKLQIITLFHYNTPRHKIINIREGVNITNASNCLLKLSSILLKRVETEGNIFCLLSVIPTKSSFMQNTLYEHL
jgi:hypothetical protein